MHSEGFCHLNFYYYFPPRAHGPRPHCPVKAVENKVMFFVFFVLLFRAALAAYRSSQARGQIRATAAGLCQSHSYAGSEPHLQPTPQLTAMLDP